jgi:hypothetical protein
VPKKGDQGNEKEQYCTFRTKWIVLNLKAAMLIRYVKIEALAVPSGETILLIPVAGTYRVD